MSTSALLVGRVGVEASAGGEFSQRSIVLSRVSRRTDPLTFT